MPGAKPFAPFCPACCPVQWEGEPTTVLLALPQWQRTSLISVLLHSWHRVQYHLYPSALGGEDGSHSSIPGGMGARGLGSHRSVYPWRKLCSGRIAVQGGRRHSLGVLAASGVPGTSTTTHPVAGSPKQELLGAWPQTSSQPHACSLPRHLLATLCRKLA